ncbi:MAG: ATP-binding cassette superfamily [Monoraphidium minutum]|nr:MAG: ATP-binding cassette superfamily [Monoraphidium minutum]
MAAANRVASAISQGALRGLPTDDVAAPGMHPFWAPGVGLRGEGVVVGVGDSGLDMDSCYFFDPTVNVAANTKSEGAQGRVFASDTHRKVAYYLGRLDTNLLDGVGHGTHVCGTIAGLPYNAASDTDDPATGQAPGARIGFIDLSTTAANEVGVPDDLDRDYFPLAYARGTRIHSDSWGSSVAIYDESAASADKFLFEHPDFLAIFAAGNYGSNQDLPTTVTSPATSKNGVAVGATMSWRRQYSRRLGAPVAEVRVEVLGAPDAPEGSDTLTLNWRVVGTEWGPQFDGLYGKRLLLAGAADGGAACTPGSADGARGGVLVALRAAGCNLATKIQVASAAGAAALLLATRQESGYQIIPQDGAPALLPVGGIPLSMAQQLRQYVSAGTNTAYVTFSKHDVCDCPSFEDIASYSSFGPTADRRTKPDIVAPGDVTSAYSDGRFDGAADQCRTMRKQGTSMATPVVAGSAALARQYFQYGFYPSGRRDPAAAHTPSGVLLKAAMLGGASDMVGYTEMSLPLEPAPGFRQGYGRLNLTRTLPVESIAPAGWRMQVVDLAALSEGETHRYCVTVNGPTIVTLVWYDWPAASSSAATGGTTTSTRWSA